MIGGKAPYVEPLFHVEVDRRSWLRGYRKGTQGSKVDSSKLLTDDGFMCCMGFACIQAGVPRKQVLGRQYPSDIKTLPPVLSGLLSVATSRVHWALDEDEAPPASIIERALAAVNDPDCCLVDEDREELIISLGLEAGILFSFVN